VCHDVRVCTSRLDLLRVIGVLNEIVLAYPSHGLDDNQTIWLEHTLPARISIIRGQYVPIRPFRWAQTRTQKFSVWYNDVGQIWAAYTQTVHRRNYFFSNLA
jgi:hypothetical protein